MNAFIPIVLPVMSSPCNAFTFCASSDMDVNPAASLSFCKAALAGGEPCMGGSAASAGSFDWSAGAF